MSEADFDMIVAGGGLASALIAWRMTQVQPAARVCVLEREHTLGANHTWSFHGTDVSSAQHAWLAPLIVQSWPHQQVKFPGLERQLRTSYHTITSQRLDAVVREALGADVRVAAPVTSVHADHVVLGDGTRLDGRCVLDARGAAPTDGVPAGYQSFLGLEVDLEAPHGLEAPVIMDARVEQFDGYRFVYLLPFTDTQLLIEDTYYNTHSHLDEAALETRINDYVAARGWRIRNIVRRERGVLPIVMAGERAALRADTPPGVVPVGVRAGLFHTLTGYSLPFAVELADRIAAVRFGDEALAARISDTVNQYAQAHWHAQAFDRLLVRLLFIAARPSERRGIFERFYGLDQALIERFYAAKLRTRDKLRILVGKPPVSIMRAIPCLTPSSASRATGKLTGAKEHG